MSFFTKKSNNTPKRSPSNPSVQPKTVKFAGGIPHPSPKKQNRDSIFEALLQAPIVDIDRIRGMAWAGIPDKFRVTVWRLFLDYEPINRNLKDQTLAHKRKDYFDCLERVYSEPQRHLWTNAQKQTITQILKDLPRTHISIIRIPRVQTLFERVLFVWSVRHPASGYVQGMNDLLQPFFFVFAMQFYPELENVDKLMQLDNIDKLTEDNLKEIEADCFWCFSKLLDGLQDLFTKDQPGLYKMMDQLQKVIDRVDPPLANHIRSEEIQFQEFAFRWMNCLLVRELPPTVLFRLWDNYLSCHSKISTSHVYTCAALMTSLSSKLIELNHSEFVMFMQSMDPTQWKLDDIDAIIAQAYVYERMFVDAPSHLRSNSMPTFII